MTNLYPSFTDDARGNRMNRYPLHRGTAIDAFASLAIAGLAGFAWLHAGPGLTGPTLSVLLPLACALALSWRSRLLSALLYYGQCSWPVLGAIEGYWTPTAATAGPHIMPLAVGAWIGASLLLATPWALASTWPRALLALALTALPPIGLIGWESPLNAAGVFFPNSGWIGLGLTVVAIAVFADLPRRRAHSGVGLTLLALVAIALNIGYCPLPPPPDWMGVDTHIQPARWNVGREIANWQAILADGTRGNLGSEPVLVFGEGLLDDWWPGTQQYLADGMRFDDVSRHSTWLIGASAYGYDALVAVRPGHPIRQPPTRAAAVLIGGDWVPWSHNAHIHGLRPAWWQHTFDLDGQRVWASICAEQLFSWTWLEALATDHGPAAPTLILAVSNAWWAPPGNAAPAIQASSTSAWARLMGLPVISATNR